MTEICRMFQFFYLSTLKNAVNSFGGKYFLNLGRMFDIHFKIKNKNVTVIKL